VLVARFRFARALGRDSFCGISGHGPFVNKGAWRDLRDWAERHLRNSAKGFQQRV
jgi:hypothetical protein